MQENLRSLVSNGEVYLDRIFNCRRMLEISPKREDLNFLLDENTRLLTEVVQKLKDVFPECNFLQRIPRDVLLGN